MATATVQLSTYTGFNNAPPGSWTPAVSWKCDRLGRILVHAHSVGIGAAGREESLGPSEVVASRGLRPWLAVARTARPRSG